MASRRRSQYETARRLAQRGIPIAMDLYRRWQQLTPQQRERYMRMARDYATRAGELRRGRGGQSGRSGLRRRQR